jgi:polypeptide N-acetylgalactosaminyltransferase
MKGWGGENLDQSLRIWTCGGEIVSAPDSFVAHMWRDGTAKTSAKYKVGFGDAVKNRARAVKAHLGPWFDKTLTFPSFQNFKNQELDTSSITDGFSKLGCENFEWYLNRFKYIYRNAGVLPKEVFQIEATSSEDGETPKCLQIGMGWKNYGNTDQLMLQDCAESPPKEPRSQYWHLSSRLEDKTCCGSLRAWNTDQCIDGRHPMQNDFKVSTYVCDLDSGVEALLKPSPDKDGEYVLSLGKPQTLCVSVEESKIKVVDCAEASTWKKRDPFTPIEYELLSEETRKEWESEE